MPATYPPEPVNGVMVSGFDSPLAWRMDASFFYPRELYRALLKEVGLFPLSACREDRTGKGWHERALRQILKSLEEEARVAEYLLGQEAWDLFAVVFGQTDTVCHHFWRFFDSSSPRYDEEGGRRFGDAIREVYWRLDSAIGRLLERAPDGATVLVISDHGAGGTGDQVIHLNLWLALEGYLTFRKGRAAQRALSAVKALGLGYLPRRLQERLFRLGGGWLVNELESRLRFGKVEWEKTRVYSEELNYFPSLWVNLRGREPRGTVRPGREYEALREEVIARAMALRHPVTGSPLMERALRREEVYWGPFVDRAPDILLELALDRGYSYSCLRSPTQAEAPFVRSIKRGEGGARGHGMDGSHRREGIFILAGEGVLKGECPFTPDLMDFAPTLLALLGIAPPTGMDGRVLEETLRTHVSEPQPISARGGREETLSVARGWEGPALLRLRDLGYLE
jgi:predicted AlkP superfamily phosphohydrolase/phosphomutase